jgi:hypothetical protein
MAALGAIRPELLVRPVGWRCPDSAVAAVPGNVWNGANLIG